MQYVAPHLYAPHTLMFFLYLLSLTCVFASWFMLSVLLVYPWRRIIFLSCTFPSSFPSYIYCLTTISIWDTYLFCSASLVNSHGSIYLFGASSKSVSLVKCCLSNPHILPHNLIWVLWGNSKPSSNWIAISQSSCSFWSIEWLFVCVCLQFHQLRAAP